MTSKTLAKASFNPYGSFRDTFGVIDPKTGKRYADIITSHLSLQYLTAEAHDRKLISDEQGAAYILHCDPEVRKALGMDSYCLVLISFQRRVNGNYAMARRYREPSTEERQ